MSRILKYSYRALGFLAAAAVLVLPLASCKPSESQTTSSTAAATVAVSYPLTITDGLGRTITLARAPQRIVSLAPSNTEILFALGLGDKVVGDTTYCVYPAAAQTKQKVGDYANINIEKVESLNPDLVLAEDLQKAKTIPALEALGISVFAVVPHNMNEVMQSFTTIGKLTGAASQAQVLVADMQNRIKYITDKTSKLTDAQRPRVLYAIWGDPLMSVGSDTPLYEMIKGAGGVSIIEASVTGFPTLALELVVAMNPQLIICNVDPWPTGTEVVQALAGESRLGITEAGAKGKIYGVNASLTNQPTPRIVDGYEWLAALIHPELFPEFVAKYVNQTK
jgi:iron complex transport system substrate-binding protein